MIKSKFTKVDTQVFSGCFIVPVLVFQDAPIKFNEYIHVYDFFFLVGHLRRPRPILSRGKRTGIATSLERIVRARETHTTVSNPL